VGSVYSGVKLANQAANSGIAGLSQAGQAAVNYVKTTPLGGYQSAYDVTHGNVSPGQGAADMAASVARVPLSQPQVTGGLYNVYNGANLAANSGVPGVSQAGQAVSSAINNATGGAAAAVDKAGGGTPATTSTSLNGGLPASVDGYLKKMTDIADQNAAERSKLAGILEGRMNPDYNSPAFQARMQDAMGQAHQSFAGGDQRLAAQLAGMGIGGGQLGAALSGYQAQAQAAEDAARRGVYTNADDQARAYTGLLAGMYGGNPMSDYGTLAQLAQNKQTAQDQGLGGIIGALIQGGFALAPYALGLA
jgi:hypothetical protein